MNKLSRFHIATALLLVAGVFAFAAQAAERNTPRVEVATPVVTAAESISAGWVVGVSGGYAYKFVSDSTNLVVLGIAQHSAVSNGTLQVRGAGVYGLKNNGSVTTAHIGGSAYAATNDTGFTVGPTGSAAFGTIVAVDSDYVWTRLGL